MPSKIAQKALKEKVITKKQYDKLPAPLLDKVAAHKLALKKKVLLNRLETSRLSIIFTRQEKFHLFVKPFSGFSIR